MRMHPTIKNPRGKDWVVIIPFRTTPLYITAEALLAKSPQLPEPKGLVFFLLTTNNQTRICFATTRVY